MNREETQAVLDVYYKAFNTMDKDGVLAVFTEDADFIDFTMGRNMKGRDELAAFIDETWRLSPYFRLEPEIVVIDDSQVAVQLYMSGAKKVDAAGRPKPGELWRIPSTSFFKFRGEQIHWKADCWNALAIPKQIGWLKTVPMMMRSSPKAAR
ncbi:nuclear transport factor 2 family protein [Qipengyuania sp. DGS5-3]|uniref:nuclear transport factor 2 family protein n=1 Tax=Qipengyuania sp. DGS5-3 TaxID=3349632 RepID=UPI0036D2337D